jgi:hypothetical protein
VFPLNIELPKLQKNPKWLLGALLFVAATTVPAILFGRFAAVRLMYLFGVPTLLLVIPSVLKRRRLNAAKPVLTAAKNTLRQQNFELLDVTAAPPSAQDEVSLNQEIHREAEYSFPWYLPARVRSLSVERMRIDFMTDQGPQFIVVPREWVWWEDAEHDRLRLPRAYYTLPTAMPGAKATHAYLVLGCVVVVAGPDNGKWFRGRSQRYAEPSF